MTNNSLCLGVERLINVLSSSVHHKMSLSIIYKYLKRKCAKDAEYQLRRLLQPISSSPRGQSRLPSHSPDLDMQTLLSLHLNACTGQRGPVHSSSEPSAQSARPSQTKNQLMQLPDDRHWNVLGAQPVRRALQLPFVGKLQSHTPPMHRDIESAIRHSRSAMHGNPRLTAVIIVLS